MKPLCETSRPSKRKYLFTGSAVILMMLSACSTPPSVETRYEPSPLCLASCPEDLGELQDNTFGATAEKLLRLIGVYRKCVAACHNKVEKEE